MLTKTNKQNLSHTKFKNFASDRKLLKQPVLTLAAMWDMEQDFEPELNIQYKKPIQKDSHPDNHVSTEKEDSENAPLLSPTRTPGKISPSKLEITFGDKTSAVIYSKRQLTRKTKARKAHEPRVTLKPQWNIIENGTITNYSPHIIKLDTDNRKNTVKNDLAFVTQPLPLHQKQKSPPKRLIHIVTCKSLRENNNNQEKTTIQFRGEETIEAKTTIMDTWTQFINETQSQYG